MPLVAWAGIASAHGSPLYQEIYAELSKKPEKHGHFYVYWHPAGQRELGYAEIQRTPSGTYRIISCGMAGR